MKNNIINKYILTSFAILIFLLFLNCCEEKKIADRFYEQIEREGIDASISEYIESQTDTFSMSERLFEAGNLKSTLTAYNPNGNNYTLFLPTNKAFDLFIENNNSFDSFQDLLNNQ